MPLIVLSAAGDWRAKVECLDAGADDYLVKPVRSEEVAARVRAVVRRALGNTTNRFMVGDFVFDLSSKCAWLGERCLDLTSTEFRLLRLFLMRPEDVHSHEEIHEALHRGGSHCSPNAVEVQIARLRRKIGKAMIQTVRGMGYRYAGEIESPTSSQATLEPCLVAPSNGS